MSLSLLQLKSCKFNKLEIHTRVHKDFNGNKKREVEAQVPEKEEVNVGINFNVQKYPDDLSYHVSMILHFIWTEKGESEFQEISAGLSGIFCLPPGTPDEEVDKYVPELCLANLYSTARGVIAQSTGLFPGGPLFLPLINMFDVVKRGKIVEEDDVKQIQSENKGKVLVDQ